MSITQDKTETSFDFELDQFQSDAIEKIRAGKSVVVCAPTGAGKTVIAEQAISDAIAEGKKVFYTTPLKALSNQKFTEFVLKYGEENVGIITGDTAKNRDAKVVIMTTEIYRNMLYGTSFGSLDPYLQDLKYVILDECHYMNDENRGTVWEESIIYSPSSVQVIGLSATVNNTGDLISWITDIHGNCELVQTHERPVPLFFLHFKDKQLVPLLSPNGKLNPKLKGKDHRFGAKRNKFSRNHNGAKLPTAKDLVKELQRKEMLPAIYFVFSRKGCDEGARDCAELKLLSDEESKELNDLIDEAIKTNSHLANHPQLGLLRKGISAHHAGLLPQWKALVEKLFNKALVKVVFATETLAAGINMPARTTVISNISKRGDNGHRNLRPSEFLQMSGRAGRRGMDKVGYVVTISNNQQNAQEVATLASAKAEDLESHFKASYEMVLNLLENHSLEETKDLIKKSFGQALANKSNQRLVGELKNLEKKADDLKHPLCPGEIGDLNHYRVMQKNLDDARAEKKLLEKNMAPGIEEVEASLEMMTFEVQNYPCNGCPKQKPCSKQNQQVKRFTRKAKDLEEELEESRNIYWTSFENIVDLLKEKGYIDENNKPTELGKICASIRSENSLLVTEVVQTDVFDGMDVHEFAAAVSTLVTESDRRTKDKVFMHPSRKVFDAARKMKETSRRILKTQQKYRVHKPVDIATDIAPIVEEWAKEVDYETLTTLSRLDDGDLIRGIRRTLDMIKQFNRIDSLNPKLKQLAKDAASIMEREPVLEQI